MVTAMAQQFNHQRDLILANLDTSRIGTKGYTRKDWLQDLLDWAAASESFRAAIEPIINATLLQAGQDATQALGIDAGMFDPYTPAIQEYFQNQSLKLAKDVSDETAKQLRASLSEGVVNGEGSFELRARVEQVMGNASTMRAERIARTEVTRAQTYGDLQAWKQSGVVEAKEFYSARDERVCPFCRSLDGEIIGLDENYFDKGDTQVVEGEDKEGNPKTFSQKISYADMPGPPAHVSCRCTLLPVRS